MHPLGRNGFRPDLLLNMSSPFGGAKVGCFTAMCNTLAGKFSVTGKSELTLATNCCFPLGSRDVGSNPFKNVDCSPTFYQRVAIVTRCSSRNFGIKTTTEL